jgi:transcriptional regulator with XRE-family HTH domain
MAGDIERWRKFGTRLRELRQQRKLTQRQLADAVGGTPNSTYISKIENGWAGPPREIVLRALARVLRVEGTKLVLEAGRVPADMHDTAVEAIALLQEIVEKSRSGHEDDHYSETFSPLFERASKLLKLDDAGKFRR